MDTQELIKQYVKIVSDTHVERGKQIVSKRLNITEEEAEALSQTDEFKEIGELKRKFDDKKRPDTDKKVKLLFNNFEDFYNWLKSQ